LVAWRFERHKTSTANSHKLDAEEIIVLFFALLGFIGSVILWLGFHSATLTSFFLGTGVASLVYRFLGGLDATKFSLGPFKAVGGLAALAGVAFGVHPYFLRELAVAPTHLEQASYEWQWAGEGWLGHISVDKNGHARVKDMTKHFVTCSGKPVTRQLVGQSQDGTAELLDNGRKLRVKIPVQFIYYDENCTEKSRDERTLTGSLDWYPAYAGAVDYTTNKGVSFPGDMVLIKGFTSGVHVPVPESKECKNFEP